MKLLFVTGSRGEWGYIRPILKICKETQIDYEILATNMHLLPQHGNTVDEIISDGYEVKYKIHSTYDGANHFTMTKSMGSFIQSLVDIIEISNPDWIILAGDRYETVAASLAGSYTYTPTAHIQAGELSGNIDGVGRHVIGKLVHLHFASNDDAKNRLLKLGEEEFRIHNVGAPQLDEIYQNKVSSKEVVNKKYNIDLNKDFFLVLMHPVTEEFNDTINQIDTLYKSLLKFNKDMVWILPNNDAGGYQISNYLKNNRKNNLKLFKNVPREDYLCFLKESNCLIGNSSSGILEAPSFKIPVVNIGSRQEGRVRSKNVIDVENFTQEDIVNAINEASSKNFAKKLNDTENPYGNGESSKKIIDILIDLKGHKNLLKKRITY
tara:strand:+ start:1092 stop:2228 length:1137 start_codon:yes stop_codon:yes gene_type:complete